MVSQEEVLRVVQARGPIIPNEIRKLIGSDTITIGALLSELSIAKKIRISKTKIGGSPFYYTEEQKAKLQDLSKHLNDKQQRTFEMLRQKKVLRDSKQEPVVRLSLRDIKDFAKPLEVNTPDGVEVFWKWYLTSNEEAEQLIRAQLNIGKPSKPAPQPKPTMQKEAKPVQKTLASAPSKPKKIIEKDDFYRKVTNYFTKKNIEILEEEVIRTGSELDFIVKVPSSIGTQEYYCKAKSKKKSNDGDLSSAYLKGQMRKLPVLYLTTGEVTKKAEEKLTSEFKGMTIKKL
ncbi:hypothetical protein ACFL1B_04770 [Nanoarchaeota archaeon]